MSQRTEDYGTGWIHGASGNGRRFDVPWSSVSASYREGFRDGQLAFQNAMATYREMIGEPLTSELCEEVRT